MTVTKTTKPTLRSGPADNAATQLEIAAHWLREAAMPGCDISQLRRVADDCLTVATRVAASDAVRDEDGA
jgi:hypothetical protein